MHLRNKIQLISNLYLSSTNNTTLEIIYYIFNVQFVTKFRLTSWKNIAEYNYLPIAFTV